MAEVNYTLTSKEDKYYITNNENLPVQVNMFEGGKCKPETSILLSSIGVGVTLEIPITKDGYYRVLLTSTEFVNTQSNIYINYFVNLQKSMIEDIFSVLCPCDCGCAACTDLSTDQYQALLTVRNKIDIYVYATSPKYDAPLTAVHKGTVCMIAPQMYCDIATEGVTGQNQYNENLTKQLIALDYLAMLYWDLKNVTDQEEIDYINDKYKSEEILCCISKLGIDINQIKQIIEDMATMTINTDAYVNQAPDVVGDNTLNALHDTDTVFTIVDFTTGTTPPYNDPEGNPAYQVRIDSLPVVGELYYNSVLLTDPADIGLIIDLVGDIDQGSLVYRPPNLDPAQVGEFNFSVNDTINQGFTS